MKRLFLLLTAISLFQFSNAQDSPRWGKYLAGSISLSNGDDLRASSYFTVEGGWTYSSLSLGLGVGRGTFSPGSERDNWFLEPKASFTLVEAGIVKGFLMSGVSGYYFRPSPHYFVEYGGGVTVGLKPFNICVQMSNWDGTNYVSLGISKSF